MPPRPRRNNRQEVTFESQLLLYRYLLSQLGLTELQTIGKYLNDASQEGYDENGNTLFYGYLSRLHGLKITPDRLREYDNRICRYTREIGEARHTTLRWKYFQYIGLLFTEYYLDRYFGDREAFACELNDFAKRATGNMLLEDVFTPDTMNKLAFMCATGSGKTLIMHANIKQFLYYLKRAQRLNSSIAINKIIVLAPNEGMSMQHLDEMKLSGINADIFNKDGGFGGDDSDVTIIDMNKLKEEGKVKTVSVDSFERNNLVLVDEAHRGLTSSDDVWYDYRTRLSEDGFAFEYSATLKQALNANSNRAEDKALMAEYGRSIIMDYSYKWFYNDGYGKDYRIYNLRNTDDDDARMLYLTGCLLSFYQQVKYVRGNEAVLRPFNIENPLLVFVGNRVTANTSDSELSDVEEVLAFLDNFCRQKQVTIGRIRQVIENKTGLVNDGGRDIFTNDFNALWDIYSSKPEAEKLYEDLLHIVMNADTVGDEPRLHVVELKKNSGEIGLRIGEYGEYFGVINIGDTAKLIKRCGVRGMVTGNDEFVADSLFRTINDRESKIKVLIGSRKFTEGWNSWRVSTMGLINFAKGEGSQAIQLFGRGVRLKGYGERLKRSNSLEDSRISVPQFIGCVETLTIFGVRAQYMEDFKKFLEQEGAPTNDNITQVRLPVVKRYDADQHRKLRVIRVKDGANFKRQARRLLLDVPHDDLFMNYLLRNKTRIDCRSHIQGIDSVGAFQMKIDVGNIPEHTIDEKYLPMLDWYRIYDELEEYKNEKGYYNLCLDRDRLASIMAVKDWYTLIIPDVYMQIDSITKLDAAADYAVMVLKSYMDKFFKFEKERWEAPLLEFAELEAGDNNFVDVYTLTYQATSALDKNGEELEKFIGDMGAILNNNAGLDTYEKKFPRDEKLVLFDFRNHLYAPLICLKKGNIGVQITPVSLNEDEKKFVDYLRQYVGTHGDVLADKSLYLLRNKSKVGIGFFEAGNFYPDYILWVDSGDVQHIAFIDPKGLVHVPAHSPKVQFYKKIKELEVQLAPTAGDRRITLDSFIMSGTSSNDLRMWWNMERPQREACNVYTLDDEQCVTKMMEKMLNNLPSMG